MQILLIGPYPPPLGGISVYIQRLCTLLREKGHEPLVLNYSHSSPDDKASDVAVIHLPSNLITKTRKVIQLASSLSKTTIVHFHISELVAFKWVAPILLFLFCRQKKVITIHSGNFIARTNYWGGRLFLRVLFCFFQHIIAVSQEQKSYFVQLGIRSEKISVIPAFLPQQPDFALLPNEVKAISKDKKIVLTSGYLERTYNYDALIDCISCLPQEEYCFIFAFYNKSEPNYEQYIYQRLAAFPNIIILRDQVPEVFITIMAHCHIYVRTTTTDGDAVAIREALSFNKVVFATDVVKRPDACHLFPLNDSRRLLQLFHAASKTHSPSINGKPNKEWEQIFSVYHNLLVRDLGKYYSEEESS